MTPTADRAEVRAARADDLEPALEVLCAAFGLDCAAARPLYYQDPFFDLSHKRVLVTPADGVISCLTVVPFSLRLGGAVVPVGGIAGVATRPERQREGMAGTLLSATAGALAEELDYSLSALFPYDYAYYRRFGWETASRLLRWMAPAAALPAYAEAARVRPLRDEADRAATHAIYAQATAGRPGAGPRDTRRWRVIEMFAPGRVAAVYEDAAGQVTGYVFSEPASDALRVEEMHGLTDAARRGLLAYIGREAAGTSGRVEWPVGRDDLTAFNLLSLHGGPADGPRLTAEPGVMLRLTDVRRALERLHAANFAPVLGGESLTVRCADALRPENARPVRISPSGVPAGREDDPDWIAADVRVLAQVYAGYRTPSEALSLGQLTTSSPRALALADRLFPARDLFIGPVDQF